MKKGFTSVIILLGIAFIILIAGVMVYQKVLAPQILPTLTSTIAPSDFQQIITGHSYVYTDNHGTGIYAFYLFKDWSVTKKLEKGKLLLDSKQNEANITIEILTNKEQLALQDFIKLYFPGGGGVTITVDGQPAIHTAIIPNLTPTADAWIAKNDDVYHLHGVGEKGMYQFGQILSTFKFLD